MRKFAIVAFVFGVVGVAAAADPTGTWTLKSKFKTKDGDEKEVESTLKLEVKDGKVTGTISGGFGGGKGGKGGGKGGKGGGGQKIDEGGTYKDGELKFTVTREFNDMKNVTKYSFKVTDDTIKGTSTGMFGDKEFKREFEGKRAKEERKKD